MEKFSLRLVDGNKVVVDAMEEKFSKLGVNVVKKALMSERSMVYFLEYNSSYGLIDVLDDYLKSMKQDFQAYTLRANYILMCSNDYINNLRGHDDLGTNKHLLSFKVLPETRAHFELFLRDKKIPYLFEVDEDKINNFRILDKHLEDVIEGWYAKSNILHVEEVLDSNFSFKKKSELEYKMILRV
ncbi:MAG: hypothetical protein KC550_01730 [Nanoarchaeota archaeon]|nr:hypothetical protein [Nanoarchaeota archaeon]